MLETGHSHADELLQTEDQVARLFFDHDIVAYFVSTPDGRLRKCNPAFSNILGLCSERDTLPADLASVFVSRKAWRNLVAMTQEKRIVRDYETQFHISGGLTRYCLVHAVGSFDAEGTMTHLTGVVFDVTERKLLAEQVRQSRLSENIGLVAVGLAQDFDNLLSIIRGHVALMENAASADENITRRLSAVSTAVNRGTQLVRQMLAFGGTGAESSSPVHINIEVKRFAEKFSESLPSEVEMVMEIEETLPHISADRAALHQALLHLALNAQDAIVDTKEKGKIIIRTKAVAGNVVRSVFPEAMANQYVCISVSDTGIGMDDQTRQRAFEPFFSTKQQPGLGLSVVHGVSRTLRGYVQVESNSGKGATFSLYLPADVLDNTSAPKPAPQVNCRGNETVLIVEDEKMLRELLVSTLQEYGYTVLSADDGRVAMDIFRASEHEIDVVLTDIGLPQQNGLEIFMKMRSTRPDIKFIFTSGYLEPHTRESLLRAGAKGVMQKPFQGEEIVRTIRQVLDEQSGKAPMSSHV